MVSFDWTSGFPRIIREGWRRNPNAGIDMWGNVEQPWQRFEPGQEGNADQWVGSGAEEGSFDQTPWFRDPTFQELSEGGMWNLGDPQSGAWKFLTGKAGRQFDLSNDRFLESVGGQLLGMGIPDWNQALQGLDPATAARLIQHAQGQSEVLAKRHTGDLGDIATNFITPQTLFSALTTAMGIPMPWAVGADVPYSELVSGASGGATAATATPSALQGVPNPTPALSGPASVIGPGGVVTTGLPTAATLGLDFGQPVSSVSAPGAGGGMIPTDQAIMGAPTPTAPPTVAGPPSTPPPPAPGPFSNIPFSALLAGAGAGMLAAPLLSKSRGPIEATAAPMTPEERALIDAQTQNLRWQGDLVSRQARETGLLTPLLLSRMGIEAVRDEQGNVVEYRKSAPTPEETRRLNLETKWMDLSAAELEDFQAGRGERAQIESLLRDRSLKALKGELPVNSALTRQLEDQRGRLEEQLLRNLGPGWETSTPGIQALAEFRQREAEIMEAARRGDIAMAEQLLSGREGASFGRGTSGIQPAQLGENIRSSRLSEVFGFPSFYNTAIQGGATRNASVNALLQSLMQGRLSGNQLAAAQAQFEAQQQAAMMQGIGNLAGMGLFAPIFGASQPTLAGRAFNTIFGS